MMHGIDARNQTGNQAEKVWNSGRRESVAELEALAECTGWSAEQAMDGLWRCSAFGAWQQAEEVPELLLDQIMARAPACKERFGTYYRSAGKGTQEALGFQLLDAFEKWQTVFAEEVMREAMALAQHLLADYRTPFEQLLRQQVAGSGTFEAAGAEAATETQAQVEVEGETQPQSRGPAPMASWMLPEFTAPPIHFEGQGNQRAKGVMTKEPQSGNITLCLETLQQNMQAIQQGFEAKTKQELEQYFSQGIPQLVQQHFATCRSNIEQNYREFVQAQSQAAQEQMRDQILESIHRVEAELEQQQQEFDSLQNELGHSVS